jgi:adenylate cyclase
VTVDADDVERSGLLDGLRDEAREERGELVRWLLGRGFSVDQIRTSLSPMLLPANRVFGDDGTFVSSRVVAESTGMQPDLIQRLHRAVGLTRVDDADEPLHSRADAEAVLPAAALASLGIDSEQVVVVVRLLMDGLAHAAVAMRQAALQEVLQPGVTELQLALALEALAQETEPLIDPLINQLARLALRNSFEAEAINAVERAAGMLPGARPITVAFADLVGFTQLGEVLPPEELGRVAGRLTDLTRQLVYEPVRFVKTIGDAVMLVSPDPEKLLSASIELLEAAAAEDFPRLRAGVATGLAVSRAGDWYGSPVNLASRITGAAPPDVVLVAESTRAAIGDKPGVSWSSGEARRLRGIEGEVRLFRANRPTSAPRSARS